MKLLLSFPNREDAERVMAALIKLQSGDAQAVHFGLLASRLARATVYGPLPEGGPPKNPCHTPNPEDTERIHCAQCGKAVSTPVPKPTIVRAWVECPECVSKGAM